MILLEIVMILLETDEDLLVSCRAGNLLIGFPSESLVFCLKNERMSDSLKKRAIHSFAESDFCVFVLATYFDSIFLKNL